MPVLRQHPREERREEDGNGHHNNEELHGRKHGTENRL
jgi:hypothetical protein